MPAELGRGLAVGLILRIMTLFVIIAGQILQLALEVAPAPRQTIPLLPVDLQHRPVLETGSVLQNRIMVVFANLVEIRPGDDQARRVVYFVAHSAVIGSKLNMTGQDMRAPCT